MSSAAPYVRYIINTFYSLFLLLLYPVRETLARPPDWLILQFHTAPGVAPILLLCRLLQLRHRQQFPSPFQQGPKLLRQVSIQEVQHCPDPLQEPGREVTITVQAVLQVRHLLPQITLSQFHHLSSSWARSLGVIGGLAP